MSTFTGFDAVEQLQFESAVSKALGKPYWKVVPGYRYYLGTKDSNSYVDVPTGFLTDGATIPRILWWLLPPIEEYTQATTLHDLLCQRYAIIVVKNGVPTEVKITRKEVDQILKEAMNVLNVTPWKKHTINLGVTFNRLFIRPFKSGAVKTVN